jgi:hypothetical protein
MTGRSIIGSSAFNDSRGIALNGSILTADLIYDNSSIRAKMGHLEGLGGAIVALERRIFSAEMTLLTAIGLT